MRHLVRYLHLGQLDTAEGLAASSIRKWTVEGTSRREGVLADITLATIHTQTCQSDATALAHHAITGVASLQSLRTRQIKLAQSSKHYTTAATPHPGTSHARPDSS